MLTTTGLLYILIRAILFPAAATRKKHVNWEIAQQYKPLWAKDYADKTVYLIAYIQVYFK
jgi:hypothetical protein